MGRAQLGQLKADLAAGPGSCGFGPAGGTPASSARAKQEFGAEYIQTGAPAPLERPKFSWRTGRSRNQGAASKGKQEGSMERARRLAKEKAARPASGRPRTGPATGGS